MRICMLAYYYWPVQTGGAESQCRKLAAHLPQFGCSCMVVTVKSGDNPYCQMDAGTKIVRLHNFESLLYLCKNKTGYGHRSKAQLECSGKQQTGKVREVGRIRRFLSKQAAHGLRYLNITIFGINALWHLFRNRRDIDIIHVHIADWLAGLGAFAGKIYKKPVVCKGANIPVFSTLHAVPFARACDRWRRKPHFIALTSAMKDDLQKRGVAADKITTIPNGVVIPSIQTNPQANTDFLFIGNFSQTAAHKAFDVLIKAWAKSWKKYRSYRLVMLGGGDSTSWSDFAAELGCDESIVFAGYQKDVTPYFLSSCCLLLPSRKEGISNALLEAQSYGLPAIVSDIPGNTEVVEHGKTGLVVPVGSENALSGAIIRIMDDSELRGTMGSNARNRIEQVFSMSRIAQRTSELYKTMLFEHKSNKSI